MSWQARVRGFGQPGVMAPAGWDPELYDALLRTLKEELRTEFQAEKAVLLGLREELRRGFQAETAYAIAQCMARVEELRYEIRQQKDHTFDACPEQIVNMPEAIGEKEAPNPDLLHTEKGPKEPVPLGESTWNALLVIGLAGAGWFDTIVASGVVIASPLMQLAFTIVLVTRDFLGEPLTAEIGPAQRWRMGAAHDHKHVDLADTSLVSRVCNGDSSLIMSNKQADLIGQVNAYLGLEDSQLTPDGLSPGTVLCVLCIFWWCLYLGRELRSILSSVEALWYVPHGPTELVDGTVLSLSTPRRCFFYSVRLSKAAISCMLLVAGILWIASTTSVRRLMLHAVVLKNLLELDTIFYGAFMPMKFQVSIKKLKPLHFRNSVWRSQIECFLVVLLFAVAMILTWSQLVAPLSTTMENLKREYCAGNQDFVVGINDHHGVAVVRPTVHFSEDLLPGFVAQEVHEYALASPSRQSQLLVVNNIRDFERTRLETVATSTTQSLQCEDFDKWFLWGQGDAIPDRYAPYWWAAATGLGLPSNSTCADMAAHCLGPHSQLLRMVCSVTCGCVEPSANPMYMVQAQGCLQQCRDEVQFWTDEMPCEDVATDSVAWQAFWDFYPSAMEAFYGASQAQRSQLQALAENMKQAGCSELDFELEPTEILSDVRFCDGHPQLFAPLSQFCPATCCTGNSPSCPSSCSA
ncbi:unnamed protein product [Symbiodinium natans]|uniref:Uncharacterized protein n=1 Tax=Symbiodinium natans TaxID=878477 RepID=A0A812LGH8_9DINO|nr:unnamed protein product [Symbiodinium natans]